MKKEVDTRVKMNIERIYKEHEKCFIVYHGVMFSKVVVKADLVMIIFFYELK